MNEPFGQIKLGHLLGQWWRERSVKARRRGWGCLGLWVLFWLSGAYWAFTSVAGIGRLAGGARLLMSLSMGGFGWLWVGLKRLGAITETVDKPHLLWIPLAFALPFGVYGFVRLLDQQPNTRYLLQRMLRRFAQSQGRVDSLGGEISAEIDALAIDTGIPFANVVGKDGSAKRIGLDYHSGEGHALVIGPTRSGKGLNLTETLLTWRGAAVVVDPKGEQLARTAAIRSQLGPIYQLPGHRIRLTDYYNHLLDRDDIAELHAHWMRPWESRETIFAEKARMLFTAAGLYAQACRLDPIRVLLDLAESDPTEALTALETVEAAKRHVRIFTNGAEPDDYHDDKFVTSAYGNFTTRLSAYQKHIDTIAPTDDRHLIPPNWNAQNGTIYITYSLQDLQGAGGVVASIIAALLRTQMQKAQRERLLVAIDELPALGLRNVADYLATTGGYGITLLLYAQSISQLRELYGQAGCQAILSNCVHQVWYPPAEMASAEMMSRLYGMTLRPAPSQSSSIGARQWQRDGGKALLTNTNQSASWSWQEKPELLPSQMLALPKEKVLVTTLQDKRYTLIADRLNMIPLFGQLPATDFLHLPKPHYPARVYTDWQSVGVAETDAGSNSESTAGDLF